MFGSMYYLMGEIIEILGILFVLIGVCVLAFFATKFIAKAYQLKGAGDNIKLRDRVMLSYDKSLVLVTVGDKTILISVAKDNIRLLCEVDENTLIEPPTSANVDFSTILKNANLSKLITKKQEGGADDK